jgi:hypothetical protein
LSIKQTVLYPLQSIKFIVCTYLAATAFCMCSCGNVDRNGKVASKDSVQVVEAQAYVKLAIVYKADSSKIIDSIPIKEGRTSVKDVMETLAKNKRLIFETKAGQHGMIDAIDGWRTIGTRQYWWLCVNDTCASAGFEDQVVAPGSTIAWHYVRDDKQPCKNCSFNK